jgi:AcrR family transcriptional regulator
MNDDSQASDREGASMAEKLTRKERDKRRNTEAILQAAEKVFAEKGFNKTKMSDIAEASEFSVGYLYNIWKSKDALYLDILISKIEDYVSPLEKRYRQASSPLDKLNILIDTHFHFFDLHRDFFKIYMSELSQAEVYCDCNINENLRRRKELFYQYAEDAFREGVEQGIFVAHSPRDLAVALKGIMLSFSMESLNSTSSNEFNRNKLVVKQLLFRSILKDPELAGKELRAS